MEEAPTPVTEVAEAFGLGAVSECRRLGRGHIHETLWLRSDAGAFVLQSLNERVFPDLDTLLANALRITEHLRSRFAASGVADLDRRVLRLVPKPDGSYAHRTAEHGVWRCSRHVVGSESRDHARGTADARSAARAFGEFARALSDLTPAPGATIPGFHDLPMRRAQLEAAAREDAAGRAADVRADVDEALALCDRLLAEHDLTGLPTRVVHNDCKLNNVLFAQGTDDVLCIVDLDTVMEGSLVYDFGELVRTASCLAEEDEPELGRIRVEHSLLHALAEGYEHGLGDLLTEAERAALPLAGARLALENALRFLADHLSGDGYFGVQRPGQNLDRHRAQRTLAGLLVAAAGEVEDVLASGAEGAARSEA